MTKFPRHSQLRRLPRHLVPVTVLVLSLLLTLGASLLLKANARARDQARFDNMVQSTADRIQRRLDSYVALLQGTEGLFSTQDEVTPEEFSAFVQLLDV